MIVVPWNSYCINTDFRSDNRQVIFAVVERILAKDDLRLENQALKVSPLKPAPSPPVTRGQIDPSLLSVRYMSPKCSTGDLKSFLSEHGDSKVSEVEYGLQAGAALVRFTRPPGDLMLH